MKFTLTPYKCGGNDNSCLPHIEAKGIITRDTPADFRNFYEKNKDGEFNRIIHFNSSGGNLLAGVDLAFLIRKYSYSTAIIDRCYSACSYAFIGGKIRKISGNQKLGVHRFYSSRDIGDERTQYITVVLSKFLDKMNVSRKMLDLASLTSSRNITYINKSLAIRLNIINGKVIFNDWNLRVNKNGDIYTCSSSENNEFSTLSSLCLYFDNASENIIAKLRFTILKSFRKPKEIKSIFNSYSNHIMLKISENKGVSLNRRRWESEGGNTFSTTFYISKGLMITLLKENEVEVFQSFARSLYDIEPRIIFKTNSLNEHYLAMTK